MPLHRRAQVNWIICLALVGTTLAYCFRGLANLAPKRLEAYDRDVSMMSFLFHAFVGASAFLVLLSAYLDPTPLSVQYKVWRQPAYPQVNVDFRHGGRWTTFTIWCNTLGVLYFCMAALYDSLILIGLLGAASGNHGGVLRAMLVTVWEITFPMSFLVNLVVSLVLIPGIKHAGKFDTLAAILRWRPLMLHNGFVIVTSFEAVLVGPRIVLVDLPIIILYGVAYYIFAHLVYGCTGVYHYFFLDPRFDYAPLGLVALLGLCSFLFWIGALLLEEGPPSTIVGFLLISFAVGTCTWPAPSGPLEGVGSMTWLLSACRCTKSA